MKLTKQQLIKVIKEELNAMLAEGDPLDYRQSGVHIVPTGTGGPSKLPPLPPEPGQYGYQPPAPQWHSADWTTAISQDPGATRAIKPGEWGFSSTRGGGAPNSAVRRDVRGHYGDEPDERFRHWWDFLGETRPDPLPPGSGGDPLLRQWVKLEETIKEELINVLSEDGSRPAYSLSPDWATASQRDQLHTQDIVPDDMRIAAEYANWPQPDDLPYVDDEDALLRMHAWAPYLSALLGMPGDPRIAPARGGSIPDPAYGPGTPEEIERTGEAWGTAPDLPARSGVTLKPLEESIKEKLALLLKRL